MKKIIKIYQILILFAIFILLVQCKDSDNNSNAKSYSEANDIQFLNPFEPDDRLPEKELDGYRLVFNDEFNHEGPMMEKYWNAETGFRRNNEHQWYQSENGVCTGGRLVITAKKEQIINPVFEKDSPNWKKNREFAEYTSASFITKKEYHQKYDSIMMIMRAKLPLKTGGDEDYGVWPAFWTTGAGSWPDGGEIDIMEYYTERMMANFAYKGKGTTEWKGNKDENAPNSYIKNIINGTAIGFNNTPDWLKKYHVWKLIGNGKWLTIYLDDVFMSRIELDIKNKDTSILEYPFKGNTCNYWINLAVGGKPHPDIEKLETTEFPRQYEIDYARIYLMN